MNKLSTLSVHVFLTVCIILSGCQSIPKNVGMSSTGADIGMVYKAKVKAIYPIYVRPDGGNSTSNGVSIIAETLTEGLLGSSPSVRALSAVSSSLARAATGMYEDRFAGLYCHYILEVQGRDLLNSISGSGFSSGSRFSSGSGLNNRPPPGFDDEGRESEPPQADYRMNDLWNQFEENLGGWEGVTKIDSRRENNNSDIFVVNPCRNFRIGTSVTISRGERSIILQPSY